MMRLSQFSLLLTAAVVLFTAESPVAPLSAHGQSAANRRQVLAAIQKLTWKASPGDVLNELRSQFASLHLISACRTLREARSGFLTARTNRVSVAFTTNRQTGLFFVRLDSCVPSLRPCLRSTAPIIIVANREKVSVFDTWGIAEFTQEGVHSFHGFLSQGQAIPSLVASMGPAGSANMMWFTDSTLPPKTMEAFESGLIF